MAAAKPGGRRGLPQPSADDLRGTPAYLLRLLSAQSSARASPAPGRWGRSPADEDTHPEVSQARDRLSGLLLRRLSACAAQLQALGRVEPAAVVYRRIVERDPLAGAVVREWMRCLIQLGRRAEAYATYRACRQQLSVLLQIKPAAETEQLAASLRQACPGDIANR